MPPGNKQGPTSGVWRLLPFQLHFLEYWNPSFAENWHFKN